MAPAKAGLVRQSARRDAKLSNFRSAEKALVRTSIGEGAVSLPGLSLAGRCAVGIGGTSGIGLALARGLAEAGADVIPTSRRREQVDAAAAEVESRSRKTLRICSDVTDRRSLEAALANVVAELGKVDILVNCAGRIRRTPTLELQE